MTWYSLEDNLPYGREFVWVKRESEPETCLAFYTQGNVLCEMFENPMNRQEFYADVSHWAYLEPPLFV